jgi:hypothetical protein
MTTSGPSATATARDDDDGSDVPDTAAAMVRGAVVVGPASVVAALVPERGTVVGEVATLTFAAVVELPTATALCP